MEWFNIKDKIPEKGSDIVIECINKEKREKIKRALDHRWYNSIDMYSTEYHVVRYLNNGYYNTYFGNNEIGNKNKYDLIKWRKITLPKMGEIKSREKNTKFTRFEIMEI